MALGAVRLAFPLHDIDRIIRAVAIAPVPGAAQCLLGVIDVAGEIVPVYDTARLLGLEGRELSASDRIILTRPPRRRAFLVSDVVGTVHEADVTEPPGFSMRASGVRGVARRDDGLLLVHDLERLMAPERAISLAPHA